MKKWAIAHEIVLFVDYDSFSSQWMIDLVYVHPYVYVFLLLSNFEWLKDYKRDII